MDAQERELLVKYVDGWREVPSDPMWFREDAIAVALAKAELEATKITPEMIEAGAEALIVGGLLKDFSGLTRQAVANEAATDVLKAALGVE